MVLNCNNYSDSFSATSDRYGMYNLFIDGFNVSPVDTDQVFFLSQGPCAWPFQKRLSRWRWLGKDDSEWGCVRLCYEWGLLYCVMMYPLVIKHGWLENPLWIEVVIGKSMKNIDKWSTFIHFPLLWYWEYKMV